MASIGTRRSAARTFIVAALLFIVGALASASINRFSRQGMRLHEARHSHTATLLDDGTILVVGGRGATGVLAKSELMVPSVDDVVESASLIAPRADHTATALAGGRVIVAGGRDAVMALDTTEVFDAATGAFSVGPRMNTARSGHTAVALLTGELLLVGGDAHGSAEILDRDGHRFDAIPASMREPRYEAAAIVLADGRVLIAGGRNAKGEPLASAELFDPETRTFVPAGTMTTSRVAPSLRLLPDGKVQLFGGDDSATMEIWNPRGYFTARAFVTAIGGGADTVLHSDASLALAGAGDVELKLPRGSRSRSIDAMSAIASKSRSARVSTGQRTYFVGGITSNLASSTVTSTSSSDAWVTTDKSDYSPGETVTITGGGFAPGETVKLYLERNPDSSPNSTIMVTADDEGKFTDSSYVCLDTDFGVTFTLTATGQSSGYVAITSFTDGTIKISSTTGSFTVTVKLFNVAGCGGAAAETKTDVVSAGPGFTNVPVNGSPTYVQLLAPATSNEGGSFVKWVLTTKTATTEFTTSTMCSAVPGGNDEFVAVYTVPAKQTPSFSNLSAPSIVYGTTPTTIGGTIGSSSPYPTGNVAITLDGVTQNAAIGANGAFSSSFATNTLPVSGSPYAVSFSYAGDSGYLAASGSSTFTVTPLSISGSFTADDKTYDGTTTATITSATPNGIINGDTVTLSGGSATFNDENVGNAKTVTGSGFSLTGTDAGNYSLGSVATATADITPLEISGSFTASDKIYDGTAYATIVTRALSGVLGADDVTLSGGTAVFDDENVGNDKPVTGSGFSLTGTDAGNYSLGNVASTTADITPLGISGSFTAANKTYDGNTDASILTRTLSGAIAGDDVALTGGTASFDDKNVGNDKTVTGSGFSLSGDDAGNYSLGSVSTTTADITPREIDGSFTADDKTYDGNTVASILTRSVSGAIGGDDVELAGGTASFDNKNVGNDKPVAGSGFSLTGADAGNYSLGSVASTTADITPLEISGSFTAANKTYDGNTTANILTRSLSGAIGGDDVSLTGGNASFDDRNVGSGKTVTGSGFSLTGADAGNYTLGSVATTTADITPLGISGSFTAANKTYDGNTDASILTRTLSGAIAGDDVALTGGTATFADKNVGSGKTVTGSGFGLDGADAGNYTLGSVATTTADITPLGITGSFTAANKTYDGTTSATILTRSLSGAIAGDDVALTGGTATFADKNAGIGKTVTATGFTLTGGDAANYALASGPWTTTANIDRATATLVVKSYAINCGDAYPSADGVASGLLAADGITFSYTIGAIATNVVSTSSFTSATYPINAVANANSNLLNYDLTITPGTLTVTNVAPAVGPITGLPTAPIAVGTTVGATATFTDAGDANAHTAIWNWGSGTTAGTVGAGAVSGSYKYTAAGVYQVAVTVTDACGLAGETIYQYVVVYDPNGGFVTGGGWINSPAGAFKANESLVGRANFGFVSKYQKGATVPTGNTEFQFKVADLNFRSTSYEWLVVSGAKAKYKGAGTINGVGGYEFLISAIDGQASNGGGVDKFRIKIWNAGGVVYDNNVNGQTGDDADPATAIEGGSITVHTK